MIIIISINVVSAEDNETDVSNVVLNTSDADLLGDTLEYNASLKSVNNTPLNNQPIVFSVNGVNYTKFTNLDGFAFLDINLGDGIYPISIMYADSNNHKLINNNMIYVSHDVGTLIKDNLSGSDIQKIIDDANSGDTLIFAGSTYNDVAINVEKSLNIISIVKSIFNGNSRSPVIKINSNDVKISNLVISGGSEGIAIENSNNVEVSYNNITNNHVGIYLKNSNNTNISFNNLLSNYNGIYVDENVLNTQIISNFISKSENDAISFAKSGSHTNVFGNTLERNENGIFIDMVGDDDLNIEYNTIQRNKGNGIYFGENYRKSDDSGILNVGNNSIVYNSEFNIKARDTIYLRIDLNTNWIASDNPRFDGVCEKIKFKKYNMNVDQLDSNTLSVSVDGIKTNSLLKYSTNGGRNWQYATLVDGKTTINVANADGNLMFDYYESNTNSNYEYQMKDYIPPTPVTPDIPVVPDVPVIPDIPSKNDDSSSDSANVNGTNSNSEQIDGNGTSTNQNSGSSQSQNPANVDNSNNAIEQASSQSTESSSSQSASQDVSGDNTQQSASDSASNPEKSVVKSLNIDEEVVRIAGIGFILALILCVIGLYYRDDVKFMLNKRNGQ